MLFDSHAHLNSERYAEDWDQVIKDIEESDLSYVMDVGFDLESSVKTVEHTKKYSWCYGAVGCHPHDAKTMDDMSLIMLKGLAKKPKIMAIGEIGLDYYHNHSPRDVHCIFYIF
jgi:TatD DNase family protein